jgi:predicted unusual protein kinase regulating ubiquinone biosynthesis (AarF/ABC1/UbiB family)
VDAKTGALTYLDFGMTVSVTKQRRKAMIRGLVGFVNKDAVSLVRDLVDLEFLPRDVDVRAATRALTKVFQGVGSKAAEGVPATTIRGTNDFLGVVSQLGTALFDHNFRLPPYFSRILRALASLEGVATGVDVNFRVIGTYSISQIPTLSAHTRLTLSVIYRKTPCTPTSCGVYCKTRIPKRGTCCGG